MADRGQVSPPLFGYIAFMAEILIIIYLLASLIYPDLRQIGGLYPLMWAMVGLHAVFVIIANWRRTDREDPQKRLSDYEDPD